MKKNRIALLAVIAVALGVAPAHSQSAAPAKLTIAWGFAGDFLPVWVAKEKGFLAKHDLDATLMPLGNGAQSPAVLESGNAQIAFTTPSTLILAVDGGLDQVAIAGAARLTKENPRTALVTRAGLTVEKPADVVGKRVGLPGINQAFDLNLKKWLYDHNIGADQFTPIEAPFPQMGDMLKSSQIDVAFLIEPLLGRVLAAGQGTRSVDVTSVNNPDQLGSVWSAKRDWATANKTAVANFRAALNDAIAFIGTNPDDAKQVEIQYLKFAEPTWPSFATKLSAADFQYWIDICNHLKLLPQPLDGSQIVFE
jgi:NitT/TauT family transport system substrate-binding protein